MMVEKEQVLMLDPMAIANKTYLVIQRVEKQRQVNLLTTELDHSVILTRTQVFKKDNDGEK